MKSGNFEAPVFVVRYCIAPQKYPNEIETLAIDCLNSAPEMMFVLDDNSKYSPWIAEINSLRSERESLTSCSDGWLTIRESSALIFPIAL